MKNRWQVNFFWYARCKNSSRRGLIRSFLTFRFSTMKTFGGNFSTFKVFFTLRHRADLLCGYDWAVHKFWLLLTWAEMRGTKFLNHSKAVNAFVCVLITKKLADVKRQQ